MTALPEAPALHAQHVAARLERADARSVLAWAMTTLPRVAVTSSFGTDSAVLLHLVAQLDPSIPVLFLETGLHFHETLTYRRELSERLGLRDVRDLRSALSVADQARQQGAGLYLRDSDRCCAIRKVAPLNAALAGFDGWVTGVRRDQTPDRADTPVVATAQRGDRTLLKVAPLASWTADDVEAYLDEHDLPRHPLGDRGYASIGCAPCTRPVAEGEDARAGRWSHLGKTECGIHLEY